MVTRGVAKARDLFLDLKLLAIDQKAVEDEGGAKKVIADWSDCLLCSKRFSIITLLVRIVS